MSGGKVVLHAPVQRLALPTDQHFKCPACGLPCVTNARTRSVQHSLPTCERWKEAIKTESGPGEFLIEAGQVTKLPENVTH